MRPQQAATINQTGISERCRTYWMELWCRDLRRVNERSDSPDVQSGDFRGSGRMWGPFADTAVGVPCTWMQAAENPTDRKRKAALKYNPDWLNISKNGQAFQIVAKTNPPTRLTTNQYTPVIQVVAFQINQDR